jgi:hypothetical protein
VRWGVSDILDRGTRNALVVAVHKAIVATFDEGDWRSLGFQMDTMRAVLEIWCAEN